MKSTMNEMVICFPYVTIRQKSKAKETQEIPLLLRKEIVSHMIETWKYNIKS